MNYRGGGIVWKILQQGGVQDYGILIAILIILVTFLTVIDWAAFDLNFYRREYEKLNMRIHRYESR